MVFRVYGWHGLPNGDGTYHWVHTPDESHANQYPEDWQFKGKRYMGEIHEEVDYYEMVTTTTLNGEPFMENKSHKHICRVCGAK